ncbi:hypothetical protein TRFO_33864 [Tritrichomonas foetus]|uniref:Protein kinase domain-containing protein n=1 Tax=Tritrichomonas foetus TaxID=1144522 RepID=A0A1J4JKJ2_9EUKA|nr:hypothetical protein TRFO_33864 [Tritrichomonas foetus]|eukprot:OHS99630.1 hypothetical protein TRFO_33864 [Tritrichomonas foetus]
MYFTADTPLPHENDIINDNYRLDYILLVTPTSILFLSTDLCDGSKKVLKFIKRFVGKEYRIENEVSITSCCNHPNIIKIYDDFEYKQFHVIVIDYTPYRCLYCIIHSHFPNGLPESTAREMFHQLLDGLNYTHSLSVIHRDIKTGNFLVFNPDLNNPLVRLTDFGYAQRLAYGELGNEYIGTPEYAAPEIFTKTKCMYFFEFSFSFSSLFNHFTEK